jgi:hypothetical protein
MLIRTDMLRKAISEAVFVLLPRYRVRLTIQHSPAAAVSVITKIFASISGDTKTVVGNVRDYATLFLKEKKPVWIPRNEVREQANQRSAGPRRGVSQF